MEIDIMKKDWKREYFSIPNLMGYFRLILIPVYLMVYIHADGMKDYAVSKKKIEFRL